MIKANHSALQASALFLTIAFLACLVGPAPEASAAAASWNISKGVKVGREFGKPLCNNIP